MDQRKVAFKLAGLFILASTASLSSVAHAEQSDASGKVIQSGKASWYGPGFHGRKTASGETFDTNELTAAHRTLPFGTKVKVINQKTGRSVIVRINDRGPYSHGRIIDLSHASAQAIGLKGVGSVTVADF